MKIYTQKEMAAYAKAGGVAEECLTNIRVVAAFAGEKKESERSVVRRSLSGQLFKRSRSPEDHLLIGESLSIDRTASI